MKKRIWKLTIACCAIIAGCYFYPQKNNNISLLVTHNVEALAEEEHYVSIFCYNIGSVDCKDRKVEVKIEGLSLD